MTHTATAGVKIGAGPRHWFILTVYASVLVLSLALVWNPGALAAEAEIEEIRRLIGELQADYGQRISELERRLEAAEQAALDTIEARPVVRRTVTSTSGSVTAGNTFNPQISVVLDGNYYRDSIGGQAAELVADLAQPSQPAHTHGHVHAASNGMNIRSGELAFTATVDPYFDAQVFVAIEGDELEIEEAWFATRNLPAGLRLKGGKFFSEFGYQNNKHEHQWDFVDQNLAYLNLIGEHGLNDTGIQLTWLPELPIYALLGAELLDGDQERLGTFIDDIDERTELMLGKLDDGPRLWTLFIKLAPDLGFDHALQLGGSFIHSSQHQEVHLDPLFESGLEGENELWALDLVYKYDNAAAYGFGDVSINAEYLRSIKDLTVRSGDPAVIGSHRELNTDGFYLQGNYGFAPRWQAGVRYDQVGGINKITGNLARSFDSSDRWSTALTWTPTDFSRFRLQYSRNAIRARSGEREQFNTLWLQFLMSLGSHGAHRF